MLTGATGMVGEGVLLHCLQSDEVSEVLMINRKPSKLSHPKLRELLVADFNKLQAHREKLPGYDACYYCAGVSSIGKTEADYTQITYDTTLNFAKILLNINSDMVFTFVSGAQTNADGPLMWQKVKGRTEDDLANAGFKAEYNFRPGFMKPIQGQKNIRWFFKPFIALLPYLIPAKTITLNELGQAMINATVKGYNKKTLEISDIKLLAKNHETTF